MSRPNKAVSVCFRCGARLYRMLTENDDDGRHYCDARCRGKQLRDDRKNARRAKKKGRVTLTA